MKDAKIYYDTCRVALEDKLFFMYHTDPRTIDVVVDFGCGDGSLIEELRQHWTHGVRFYGVDTNEYARRMFKVRNPDPTMWCFPSMEDVKKRVKKGEKKMIILSSVLHELPEDEIPRLRDFDVVVIRDMLEPIPGYNIEQARGRVQQLVNMSPTIEDLWKKFRDRWGVDPVHFLLKYKYLVNWETELEENYFTLEYGKLMKLLKNHRITYFDNFVHLYMYEGEGVNIPTHVKVVAVKC